MHGPPDASAAPRYTGVRTFARCPLVRDGLDGVDVAAVGVPFDTATSFRPGARFGPEAIRSASVLLRPWHPVLEVDVFAGRSVIDYGDVDITPGNAERTTEQIAAGLAPLLSAGVVPIVLGGDHSVALGELRAHAAACGSPVAVVLLDAHADTWDQYYGERYFHGTVFRRAAEEGVVAPERSVLAGMRGGLYSASDMADARGLGFDVVPDAELRSLGPDGFASRVRARVENAPAVLGFDVDVVDPAFAPGTGTPEVGGLTSVEALGFVRALAGMRFRGFDVVEVAPPYDGPGQPTALLAANVAWEFLALSALAGSS
ncbi:MAG: agmatinase [Thermoleophilaceae bacterium]|jgi:agmatinase|nr:agmatinase [Thermoleophilaceae bacterium]